MKGNWKIKETITLKGGKGGGTRGKGETGKKEGKLIDSKRKGKKEKTS